MTALSLWMSVPPRSIFTIKKDSRNCRSLLSNCKLRPIYFATPLSPLDRNTLSVSTHRRCMIRGLLFPICKLLLICFFNYSTVATQHLKLLTLFEVPELLLPALQDGHRLLLLRYLLPLHAMDELKRGHWRQEGS